jgi:hypothetical protein
MLMSTPAMIILLSLFSLFSLHVIRTWPMLCPYHRPEKKRKEKREKRKERKKKRKKKEKKRKRKEKKERNSLHCCQRTLVVCFHIEAYEPIPQSEQDISTDPRPWQKRNIDAHVVRTHASEEIR